MSSSAVSSGPVRQAAVAWRDRARYRYRGIAACSASRVKMPSSTVKRRVAELEQRDEPGQVRLQHEFGLTGGGRGGGQLPGDAQPFGRGARLPAHVGQREQRVGEHAGRTGQPGAVHRRAGEPDGTGQISIRAVGELAGQRRGQQPARGVRAGRGRGLGRGRRRGGERGERLFEQRDHRGSRGLGSGRDPVGAEGRPGEQCRVAGRAGAGRRFGQDGLRLVAVPGAAQRVPVFAQGRQLDRARAAGDLDGAAEVGGGFVEGGAGGGFPGRLGERGDRAVTVPERPGHAAVVGGFRGGRAGLLLQQAGQLQVQLRPPGRGQPLVEDIAEQVMAEPQVAGFVLIQDRGADGAVEERQRRPGGGARQGGDGGDREPSPGDRGHGEQVHDLAGQPGQAPGQDIADRGRHAGHQGPVEGRVLGGEQPGDLLGEEGVARRAVVHRLDQPCLRALAADLLDQLAGLGRRQPGELDQLRLPGHLGQQRAGRMISGRHLHVAVGPDDQHGGVMQLAGEEHEQAQRRQVRPVQVVKDDHQGPLRRLLAQVRRGPVIDTEADRGLVAQDAASFLGGAGQLGQHGLAGRAGRARPARCGALALLRCQRAHHLDPRPEAGGTVALPARAPHGGRPAVLRVRDGPGGERGLAHAGLAREEDDPARSPGRGVGRRVQGADRQPPPDKHVCRHAPILSGNPGFARYRFPLARPRAAGSRRSRSMATVPSSGPAASGSRA